VSKKKTGSTNISSVIRKHLDAFRKPGVLTVRPGYEIREHQLTGKEAIVATVHTKKKIVARQDLLPDTVDGVPVDVREATPFQRLRAADPGSAAIAKAYGRQELNEPVWPGELEMPSGKPLVSKPAPSHIALDALANKPQVPYTPAPGASLVPVEDTMTITTAVSPDCGLDTLDNFLATSKSSLVIGMYDFTSGPILTTFENLLKSGRTLQMVLDNPPLNPTANQSDPETMHALQGELGARFQFEWALERNDGHVSAWVFPSAYHIKVIVRDGSAVWLSSGNLNNSNEPDFDAPPKTEDRDWHVIVENQNVAKTFSAFIQHDFQVASGHQAEVPDVVQSAVRRSMLKLADNTNPPPTPNLPLAVAPIPQFKPQTFQNANPKITPLLTPDSLPNGQGQYMSQMLALIESAKKSLDIQLQYIEVPKGDSPGDLKNLLLAVKALVDDGVVQVRVIQSLQYGEKWAEQMRSMPDIDLTPVMKLQPNVHNKGFVIDSQTVVVSSQNWSGAGIRQNRDAGLIIESPAIAQYFESVFNSDWTKNKPFNPQAAAPTQRGVSVAGLRSREPGTSTAKQRSTKRKRSGKPAR
jgi:phosphatidylserine/phosphatidylglycerophosphate/cardiolipin synthase-like enzyme